MALPEFARQDQAGSPFTRDDLLRSAPVIVVLLRGFF